MIAYTGKSPEVVHPSIVDLSIPLFRDIRIASAVYNIVAWAWCENVADRIIPLAQSDLFIWAYECSVIPSVIKWRRICESRAWHLYFTIFIMHTHLPIYIYTPSFYNMQRRQETAVFGVTVWRQPEILGRSDIICLYVYIYIYIIYIRVGSELWHGKFGGGALGIILFKFAYISGGVSSKATALHGTKYEILI